jgi:hypothetical protein
MKNRCMAVIAAKGGHTKYWSYKTYSKQWKKICPKFQTALNGHSQLETKKDGHLARIALRLLRVVGRIVFLWTTEEIYALWPLVK